MKLILTAAILAVAALLLGVTLLTTQNRRAPVSPAFKTPAADWHSPNVSLSSSIQIRKKLLPVPDIASNKQTFALSDPEPRNLRQLPHSSDLPSGVYQTYPYTIILVVPERGIDDGILGETPNPNSQMPRIRPHVEVIPR